MNNENQLAEALRAIDNELSEYIDQDAFCDHSVGICWCSYLRAREKMREALAALEASKGEVSDAGLTFSEWFNHRYKNKAYAPSRNELRACWNAARNAGGSK